MLSTTGHLISAYIERDHFGAKKLHMFHARHTNVAAVMIATAMRKAMSVIAEMTAIAMKNTIMQKKAG